VEVILKLLDKYAPEKSLLTIRTTDISKRPENLPEEIEYSKFCNEAKKITNIGTQDAMRKNLFVDFHRMQLINRYDYNKNPIRPHERKPVKYVSLSRLGYNLIKETNELNKYYIYSKAIDHLIGGQIDIILDILRTDNVNLQFLKFNEYLFFITAIGFPPFNLTIHDAVSLINSYRNLSRMQKESVIAELKKHMDPDNFHGNKNKKRDFSNWRNETTQVFKLLSQTVYFETVNNKLKLRININDKEENVKLLRSISEKNEYFKQHKVNKKAGFELHHIVPLAWSESKEHFKLIDKWMNMIYLDGFNHAVISQSNNRYAKLEFVGVDVNLGDHYKKKKFLKKDKNVIYNPNHQNFMKEYNFKLLNTENLESVENS
jgi:hypothetical protein